MVTTVVKKTLANVLFVFILFCVGAAGFLLEVDPFVTAVAVVATGIVMLIDDRSIRAKRRRL